MNGRHEIERQSVPQGAEGVFDVAIRSLSEQLSIIQGDPARVAGHCGDLGRATLFRPHSFIHTHVNTMAWQMPFTLLGLAFAVLSLQSFTC